ncbi:MAG: peptidyl-prolyl cis-trans isomerase [Candidatus Eisenbacteria bacterium]|nr:peptidyl-prolyl cis-trans isomerase [Candidatus Eisenbacteria bacterium]
MIRMVTRCRTWLGVAVALVALSACGSESPDAVAHFRGWSLDGEQLQAEWTRVNPDIPWTSTTVEQRAEFAGLLMNKELLVRIADKACPEPGLKRGRLHRVLYEKNLSKAYLDARRERFSLPESEIVAAIDKLKRRARVQMATVKQADIDAIRQEMLNGGSFEEVAKKYANESGPGAKGFVETELGIDVAPRPLVRAVFLEDVPPGTVVGPVSSTQANYFLRVVEFTPWDFSNIPGAMERARSVVTDIHYQPFNNAYVESLNTAAGLAFHEESYPIVQEIMQTFWDSVNAARMNGAPVDFQTFRAPVWLVPEDKAEVPVMELFGKTYTVREFVKSLDDVDLDSWVTVGQPGKIAFQIDTRGRRLLNQLQAEKMGVQNRPEFLSLMGRQDEQHLLDEFRDVYLAGQYQPDEAKLQELYRDHPDLYMTTDQVAYGLLIFPPDKEARARQVREKLRGADPVAWFEIAAAEAKADPSVLYYADTGLRDVSASTPDPSWVPFKEAALTLEPEHLSEVLRTQHGFTIVRCNQRMLPRRKTYEEAHDQVLSDSREIWLNAEIDRRLSAAQTEYKAVVDTARIEALMAGGGSPN